MLILISLFISTAAHSSSYSGCQYNVKVLKFNSVKDDFSQADLTVKQIGKVEALGSDQPSCPQIITELKNVSLGYDLKQRKKIHSEALRGVHKKLTSEISCGDGIDSCSESNSLR